MTYAAILTAILLASAGPINDTEQYCSDLQALHDMDLDRAINDTETLSVDWCF